MLRLEEERHVGKFVSASERLHVGYLRRAGIVGDHRQRFVGRGIDRFAVDLAAVAAAIDVVTPKLVPDDFVKAFGVAFRGGEQVDDKQVYALLDQVRRGAPTDSGVCSVEILKRDAIQLEVA